MKELLEFMAKSLVEQAEAVEVTSEETGTETVYHIKTADSDIGRVIGKQGRIIKAIRTVAKAAAVKEGTKVRVEIVE